MDSFNASILFETPPKIEKLSKDSLNDEGTVEDILANVNDNNYH